MTVSHEELEEALSQLGTDLSKDEKWVLECDSCDNWGVMGPYVSQGEQIVPYTPSGEAKCLCGGRMIHRELQHR